MKLQPSPALRLFVLRCTHSNKLEPDFFPSKKAAKAERDSRNAQGANLVVSPGPDHIRNTGHRV